MASVIFQYVVTATHDGVATLRRSFRVVRDAVWVVSRSGGLSHHGDAEGPRPSSAEPLYTPWHFLYFFPLPQGQGSLRPTLSSLC
jgi:hypothetical protein